jgi:uncharacterized protein YkwD
LYHFRNISRDIVIVIRTRKEISMKKLTLLTATALTVMGLAGQTLPVQAASRNYCQVLPGGGRIFITYGSDCNLQNILDKLENCFPGITLPNCELPESDAPETDAPEVDLPETDAPENNVPDNAPNIPGNGSTEESTPDDTPADEHAFIKQVVALVNQERVKEGLAPLTIDTKVQVAAQVRAKECEQLFSHTRPDGSSFSTALKEQNVSYRSSGENIAWGQRSPEEVMKAWMNSSGHRANIMNPNFTTIGVGYYENATGTDYWCQLFTR